MKSYEGMILFDNGTLHDWPSMAAEVKRLCDRIDATLHVCVKFDERKLAYEIRGRKRGTYALLYFDAPPLRITEMERDAVLNENILRFAIFRIEPLSEAKLAELKAHPADQPWRPLGSGDRRDDRGDWRDSRDYRDNRDSRDHRDSRGRRDAEADDLAGAGVDALGDR